MHVLGIVCRDRGVAALHQPAVLYTIIRARYPYIPRRFLNHDREDDAGVDFRALGDGDDGGVDRGRFSGGVADGEERVLPVEREHGLEGHPVPEGDFGVEGCGGAGEALVGVWNGVAGVAFGEAALVEGEGCGVGDCGGGAVAGEEGGVGGGIVDGEGGGEGEVGGEEELEGGFS